MPGITIEELARRVGMTARNIRAHQSRGLVPPPVRRGRTAYYEDEHVAALERIKELQSKGYNLAAIAALMNDTQHGDPRAAMQRLVLAPLMEADDIVITREDMRRMFHVDRDPDRLRLALESGLLVDLGDDHFRMGSSNVLAAARRLSEMGMPIIDLFEMQVQVSESSREIARRFVETSLACALEPYGDEPSRDDWEAIRVRFDELRQLTASMLAATFALSVRRATEEFLEKQELPGDG